VNVLQPILHFGDGRDHLERELVDFGETLHRGPKEVRKALERAERFQARFYQSLLHRGKEILDRVEPNEKVMVIVGRPYNSCDSGVNLEIPKKLRELGVLSIPMDFLPIDSVAPTEEIREMYWRYGEVAQGSEIRSSKSRVFHAFRERSLSVWTVPSLSPPCPG
jgi:predicted nucleotide-binding protein (sugar kinase/HSP70/actin superfamily)